MPRMKRNRLMRDLLKVEKSVKVSPYVMKYLRGTLVLSLIVIIQKKKAFSNYVQFAFIRISQTAPR